jgi:hypothetical protein
MKFIELPRVNGDIETVNVNHIIKIYPVTYNAEEIKSTEFTRVIFSVGGGMIDSTLTVSQILHRIKN